MMLIKEFKKIVCREVAKHSIADIIDTSCLGHGKIVHHMLEFMENKSLVDAEALSAAFAEPITSSHSCPTCSGLEREYKYWKWEQSNELMILGSAVRPSGQYNWWTGGWADLQTFQYFPYRSWRGVRNQGQPKVSPGL